MRVGWVACLVVSAVAMAVQNPASQFPGEGAPTMNAGPQAEPHLLEETMNSGEVDVPQGRMKSKEEDMNSFSSSKMAKLMKGSSQSQLPETAESIENGASNELHHAQRARENEFLPDSLRHKTLADIWKNELPCECPFHIYKPVCGVDGNTYPTACFAECINVAIFVHADCKYVKRELWARYNADKVPTELYEDCVQGDDDADDEHRTRCRRQSDDAEGDGSVTAPQPYEEQDDEGGAEQATGQVLMQAPQPYAEEIYNAPVPVPPTKAPALDSAALSRIEHRLGHRLPRVDEEALHTDDTVGSDNLETAQSDDSPPYIEWRTFQGVRVPYDTRDIPNPCPQCSTEYIPACGTDNVTYPSACFAGCVGAEVARLGECNGETAER